MFPKESAFANQFQGAESEIKIPEERAKLTTQSELRISTQEVDRWLQALDGVLSTVELIPRQKQSSQESEALDEIWTTVDQLYQEINTHLPG